jgi:hypothetical protein
MEIPGGGRTSLSVITAAVLAVLLFRVDQPAAAGDFDSGRASFRVGFGDEVTPYKVTGAFVLPGEKLKIEVPPDAGVSRCGLDATAGQVVENGRNRWIWEAPHEPGGVTLVIHNPEQGDSVVLNTFVMIPFVGLKGEYLNNYRIGRYPTIPLNMLPMYKPPKGFIEVTEANLCTPVSPHFQLGQFICKQSGGYPKYLVLKERLILKLELILEKMNEAGYRYDTFNVMSGYRTPYYNHAIGNVQYSRHLWGGAADIFLDADADGIMDDLNCDGKIDYRDADVIYDIVDQMYTKPWYQRFLGGLAKYKKTSSHGPFVHVDVRGARVRWGD